MNHLIKKKITMETLFIITQVKKTFPILLGVNSYQIELAEPYKPSYATYPEAEAAIPALGKGIYQIQKIYINQE